MKTKEKYMQYVKVAERAEKLGYEGERVSLLMDIESADNHFKMRLEDWLEADDFNFMHDVYGIVGSIDRTTFPSMTIIPLFGS